MDDPLKLGIYVLLLLRGFIFVQVYEHHLLREKKEQFAKTLEIILYSAFIWAIVWLIFSVGWPSKEAILRAIKFMGQNKVPSVLQNPTETRSLACFFLTVCGLTFVVAHVWGIVRKAQRFDAIVKFVTGRDWYPSVAFRFFKENLNKAVIVSVENRRYLGILFSAPDTKEDKYVILTKVSLLPSPGSGQTTIERLPLVDYLLIKFDDIREIQALTRDVLRRLT